MQTARTARPRRGMPEMDRTPNPAAEAAMQEGMEAARAGKSDKSNPYTLENSASFGAWLAGWLSHQSSGSAH